MRAPVLALGLCLPGVAALAADFAVTSTDIHNGKTIPMAQVFNAGGCTGNNRSPALAWSGAPAGTQSFAVTMYDPDAPTGSGWWHWTVFNIPPNVHGLPANAGAAHATELPAGAAEGGDDFGFSHYGGPCPPVGDRPHRYVITVYAVKVATLPLDAHASGAAVGVMLDANALATTRITGRYGRTH